ncbi:MAG TPA: LppX_LprAFG lipoprotein [Acidimicrobiales bacterium]|nr:LppX_LprAFG lipoprotein [Acidimicrobiales bacterium]
MPALIAITAPALLAACGSSTPKVSAPTLVQKAKATLDATSTAHFKLTSKNVALSGTNLIGGEGDLARPASLQGTFSVAISGFSAKVAVVSVNGVFEAQLPFHTGYQKANPSDFGLTDPAQLLNPDTGLTKLLSVAQNPRSGPTVRSNGELLDTVTYTVPGSSIPVLPDTNRAQPVTVTLAINPSNYQLRTVTLVGPFTTQKYDSTYQLTLTGYNEHVNITLPPVS